MPRTLDQLNSAFDTLTVRVNQLDGIGLPDQTESTVASLKADVEGLRETVNQVVLTLDGHLNDMETSLAALQKLVNEHLGLAS
jgi:hypothetical protein